MPVQILIETQSLYGDVDNADVLIRFVSLGVNFGVGNPLDCLHAICAPSKHSVLVIEPGLRGEKHQNQIQNDQPQLFVRALASPNERD